MPRRLIPIDEMKADIELLAFINSNLQSHNDCELWLGRRDRRGYGLIQWQGKSWLVHRVRWALHHDKQPPALIRHRCDTPLCSTAAHLVGGTPQDNADDKILRGRTGYRRSHRGRHAAALLAALRADFAKHAPDELPSNVHWHFHCLGLALEQLVFEQIGVAPIPSTAHADEDDPEYFDSLYC